MSSKDNEIKELKAKNKKLKDELALEREGPFNPFKDPHFFETHGYAGGGAFPLLKKKKD
jgi:hypothetical protein